MEDYFPSVPRALASLSLSLLLSWYGVRRKSLSLSGGVAAIVVGGVLTAASGCFCFALLTFFLTSSKLTKWRTAEKKKLEQDHKEGGQRDWIQVICNGGVATVAAVYYIVMAGYGEHPFLSSHSSEPPHATIAAAACLSALACSCGDTWASEVGSVAGGTPYLITTWRRVPRGTNGGVTLVGVACSLAGGMVVGVAYCLALLLIVGFEDAGLQSASVIAVGGMAGLYGSLVDSLLGATVQYSGYSKKLSCVVHGPQSEEDVKHISGWNILDNHAVNFLSSLITAMTFAFYYYCTLEAS